MAKLAQETDESAKDVVVALDSHEQGPRSATESEYCGFHVKLVLTGTMATWKKTQLSTKRRVRSSSWS